MTGVKDILNATTFLLEPLATMSALAPTLVIRSITAAIGHVLAQGSKVSRRVLAFVVFISPVRASYFPNLLSFELGMFACEMNDKVERQNALPKYLGREQKCIWERVQIVFSAC